MLRYLGVSVVIGLLVSLLVGAFCEVGLFEYFGDRTFGILHGGPLTALAADAEVSRWWQYPVLITVALAVAWTSVDISGAWKKFGIAAAVAGLVLGLSFTLAVWGQLFEPLSGVIAVAGSYAVGALHSRSRGGSKQRAFMGLLGGRLSGSSLNSLIAEPSQVKLAGGQREVSILVMRVTNGIDLAGVMKPSDLVAMTNLVNQVVSEFLLDRGGYLESVGPEGVRVLFGLPKANADHAATVCTAALELRGRLGEVARECEGRWLQVPEFGVGVMSGLMAAGVFGAGGMAHFGALGGESEFARRLAGANRSYGSLILIGARTQQLAEASVEVRPMEMLYEPEAGIMIEVYELLSQAGELSEMDAASRDAFWQGVVQLRQGLLRESMEQFNLARREGVVDPPLDYYLSKIDWLLSHPAEAGEFADRHGVAMPGARLMESL
jgi:adenylate cyclase